MLPTHLIPVVLITRCFCSVIASAPPAHSAFTTAWMSCWCTTSWSAVTSPSSTARSISSFGASLSTTVTAGPCTSSKPAGPRRASTWSCSSLTWASSTFLPERVDLAGQRAHLLLQVVGALPLLAYDGVQVGHAGGAQVQAPGGQAAGHEQGSGHHEDHDGDESPACAGLAMTVGAQRGACSRGDVP